MGMYDILGKEEVKCFPTVFPFKDEIWVNYGTLTSYQKGDTLPLANFIYEYPQNFFIIEVVDKLCVHVIKNGKYEDTIYENNNLKTLEYKNCFSLYGEKLEIKSFEDIKSYEEAMKLFFHKRIELYKVKRHSEVPEIKQKLLEKFVNKEFQILLDMGMYISVFMENDSISFKLIDKFQEFWNENSFLYPQYKERFSLEIQKKIDDKIRQIIKN